MDHRVLVWTAEGESTHAYSHADPVSCLGYDHDSSHLASASASELIIWAPATRSAVKHKVLISNLEVTARVPPPQHEGLHSWL